MTDRAEEVRLGQVSLPIETDIANIAEDIVQKLRAPGIRTEPDKAAKPSQRSISIPSAITMRGRSGVNESV